MPSSASLIALAARSSSVIVGRRDGLLDDAELLLEVARGVHLLHDVAAAEELAVDVELRDGRPARVLLDAVANGGIGEHVDRLEGHARLLQDADHLGREAALREVLVAFHEENDTVLLHEVVELLALLIGEGHRDRNYAAPAGRQALLPR